MMVEYMYNFSGLENAFRGSQKRSGFRPGDAPPRSRQTQTQDCCWYIPILSIDFFHHCLQSLELCSRPLLLDDDRGLYYPFFIEDCTYLIHDWKPSFNHAQLKSPSRVGGSPYGAWATQCGDSRRSKVGRWPLPRPFAEAPGFQGEVKVVSKRRWSTWL